MKPLAFFEEGYETKPGTRTTANSGDEQDNVCQECGDHLPCDCDDEAEGGPAPAVKREGYECGICGHYHPTDWDGDCRDDANRFSDPDHFSEIITWEEMQERDGGK